MKKIKIRLTIVILLGLMLTNIKNGIVRAENLEDNGYFEANEIILNGEKLDFNEKPVLKDGRTLVPGKALFEKLGFEFILDEKNKVAYAEKEDINIKLALDKAREGLRYKNIKVDLDIPASVFKEKLIVPIRVIGEILDLEVSWDSLNRNVILQEIEKDRISLEKAHSILVESEKARFGKNINMEFIHMPALDYNYRIDQIKKDNYIFRVDFTNARFDADYLYCINKKTGEIYLYLADHSFELMSDIENSTGVSLALKNLPLELESGQIFTSMEILEKKGKALKLEDIEELKIIEVASEENIIGKMSKKDMANKYDLKKYGDMYSLYVWVDILEKVDSEKEYMWVPTINSEEIRDNLNKINFTKNPMINEVYINGNYSYRENSEGIMVNEMTYSLENPMLEIAAYDAINLKDLNSLDVYLIDENNKRVSEVKRKNIYGYDEISLLRPLMDMKLPTKELKEGLYELIISYDGIILYRKDINFIK